MKKNISINIPIGDILEYMALIGNAIMSILFFIIESAIKYTKSGIKYCYKLLNITVVAVYFIGLSVLPAIKIATIIINEKRTQKIRDFLRRYERVNMG